MVSDGLFFQSEASTESLNVDYFFSPSPLFYPSIFRFSHLWGSLTLFILCCFSTGRDVIQESYKIIAHLFFAFEGNWRFIFLSLPSFQLNAFLRLHLPIFDILLSLTFFCLAAGCLPYPLYDKCAAVLKFHGPVLLITFFAL